MDPFDKSSEPCGSRDATTESQNESQEGGAATTTSASIGEQADPSTNRIDSAKSARVYALLEEMFGRGTVGAPLGPASAEQSSTLAIPSTSSATSFQGQGIVSIQMKQKAKLLALNIIYSMIQAGRDYFIDSGEPLGPDAPKSFSKRAPIGAARVSIGKLVALIIQSTAATCSAHVPLDLSMPMPPFPQFPYYQLMLSQNASAASSPVLHLLPAIVGVPVEDLFISEKQFNDLTNELISKILDKFETHEQMSLRLVSKRFKDLIEGLFGLTVCLKLDFVESDYLPLHTWNPYSLFQYYQFETNWIEPTSDPTKTAKLIVRGNYDGAEDYYAGPLMAQLRNLFPNVSALVIYYELQGTPANMSTCIARCIDSFPGLTSFSVISSHAERCDLLARPPYPPSVLQHICNHLGLMDIKLNRLDLFLEPLGSNVLASRTANYELNENFLNVLARLEHFSMIDYPLSKNTKPSQILLKGSSNGPQSLCIRVDDGLYTELLNSKPNLAQVQRLQLTNVDANFQVDQLLKFCPNVKSLGLYYRDPQYRNEPYFSNHHLDWIGRQSQLTDLLVFRLRFANYECGPTATNIRKLTIGMNNIFTELFWADRPNNTPEGRQSLFEETFVPLIECKFPHLDELCLVECNNCAPELTEFRQVIRSLLYEKLPKLKFTIFDL